MQGWLSGVHLDISLIEKQLPRICFRLETVGITKDCPLCEFMFRHPEHVKGVLGLLSEL